MNAKQNYYAAPAQVDGNGVLIGHSHVVVEKLTSLTQTEVTDPNVFAFFKYVFVSFLTSLSIPNPPKNTRIT